MVTIRDDKKAVCITLYVFNIDEIENVTKQVIPTGMFYMDTDGDYVVEDIDEYIRRALEWLNEDGTGIRSLTISKANLKKEV